MISSTRQTLFSSRLALAPLAATMLLGGLAYASPAAAQTQLRCTAPGEAGPTLSNQAEYSFSTLRRQVVSTYDTDSSLFAGMTEPVVGEVTNSGALMIALQGVRDGNGNLVFGLGDAATAIQLHLSAFGWSDAEAADGSVAAVSAFASQPAAASMRQVTTAARQAIAQAVPARAEAINQLGAGFNQQLAVAFTGLSQSTLESIGFTTEDATLAHGAAAAVVGTTAASNSFDEIIQTAYQDAIAAVPARSGLLNQAQRGLTGDRTRMRSGQDTRLQAGDIVQFEFALRNTGRAPIQVQPPGAPAIQRTGMTGPGTVVEISVDGFATVPASLTIQPDEQMKLRVNVRLQAVSKPATTLVMALGSGCGGGTSQQTMTLVPPAPSSPLIDPLGRITGCAGELLPDYRGFSVGFYYAANGTGDLRNLVQMTATELPDNPNNRIPAGLEPNRDNSNPFFLTNADQGRYNFLLDEGRGQLRQGETYILVVNPPADSNYSQRRIRIAMGQRTGDAVAYTATSLDGRPISATNNRTSVSGTIRITDAEGVGLVLAVLDLDTGVCNSQSVQIVKTGDRAAAEPGDTVIYRLSIRNLASAPIANLAVTDTLPLGFSFISNSTRAEIGGELVDIEADHNGRDLTFRVDESLEQGDVLNIVYAAQLTPDAVRGNGQNSAIVTARRSDNNWVVRDGPAIHRLRVQPGIVSDGGTIIGRVFVDKNFDGEQQPGEPGVPNAVIFMDDGNRITTDADGLFSVANVLPGYRTGALDLTSLPGYTLAPNHYFIERNSPSRLVHLEPGGLVRMNFAVTPTFQEGQEQ